MIARIGLMACMGVALLLCSFVDAAQDKKPRTGTVIGEVKAQKDTKDGKNTAIEILAPGEEKARVYHVMYDPKIKGPFPEVLKAVRAAKVGERVQIEWIDTNHGPMIQTFAVLKKGVPEEKK